MLIENSVPSIHDQQTSILDLMSTSLISPDFFALFNGLPQNFPKKHILQISDLKHIDNIIGSNFHHYENKFIRISFVGNRYVFVARECSLLDDADETVQWIDS